MKNLRSTGFLNTSGELDRQALSQIRKNQSEIMRRVSHPPGDEALQVGEDEVKSGNITPFKLSPR